MLRRFRAVRPYVLLFAGLSVIYHSNLRPIPSGDSLCTSLLPLSLLLDHTVTLDRFAPWLFSQVPYAHEVIRTIGGHYYSGYPIGGPILVTPLYLPLLAFPGLRHLDPGSLVALARILEKFAATTIAAFSSVVLLLLLKRITSSYWAWRLTLVNALGTLTWSIASQALWQHTTGQLAILGSLLFLESWFQKRDSRGALWACGACSACALAIRPSNIILLLALAAAFWIARASVLEWARWAALPVAAGLAALAYNLYFFHIPTGTYTYGMWAGSMWIGLAGLIFSPGRGVLFYIPVVLFAICAFLPAARATRAKHVPLMAAVTIFSALHYVVMSRVGGWWGGYCWGPRYLTEIMPLMIILIALGAPVLERPWVKRAFVTVAVYCVLIEAVGVYFYPKGHWDNTPIPVDQDGDRNWDWKDNPIRRTLAAGPTWEPYAIVGAALIGGPAAASEKMHELDVHTY